MKPGYVLLAAAMAALAALALNGLHPPGPPDTVPDRVFMATSWIGDRTNESVREMVRQMAEAGANTIAIGVHDTGVLYFRTDSMNLTTIDLFPEITDEARKQGLKVFAWTDTINFPELLDEHPEWEFVTCFRSGRYHYPSDCGWHDRLSPFSPGIDDFVGEYYRDLAALDIDGIQFQDDLFLAEGEDFSDAAQEAFLEHYGHPPDPTAYEDLRLMQALKVARITELTGIAMESARDVNPDLVFVFDVLPEADSERMLEWWSIDVPGLMDAGVDYIGIMSYHPQIMKEMRTGLDGSMEYLNDAFESISGQAGRYGVIYRLWTTTFDDDRDPLPSEEIGRVVSSMIDAGAYHMGYVPHHPGMPGLDVFAAVLPET